MQPFDIIRKYNFWDKQPIAVGKLRPQYLEVLESYLGNALVKVILGQRRAGKSYLLRMLIQHLQTAGKVPAQNILYINKDLHGLEFINHANVLMQIIAQYQKQLKPTGKIYLFLDEIQEIEDWEKAVNSLSQDYTQEYEIFITGSNAHLLSSELATYLSGRYVEMTVFPFSYTEYLAYYQSARGKQSFIDYLQTGGIPELYHLTTQEMQRNYIGALKDSIVLRDIVNRHHIRDIHLLERLIDFLIDSTGNLFSINAVVAYLKSSGQKTNHETIGAYLQYLQDAFFIHDCNRFDIQGKNILKGERKYYLNDLAFKYHLTSSFNMSIGKFLENAVYLSLKRKGYTVYVGRLAHKEIDFIAQRDQERIYVQVAYLLPDEKVIEREFGNLMNIPDSYPKIVVTLDEINLGNRQGIIHQPAWEFID